MHEQRKNGFTCGNCGAPLQGHWCHCCGQKRLDDEDRRFGHVLGQFAHELFHANGKLPASLGTLLFRPGMLTRAYLDGQRVRYLTPIALFLLINLVYFIAPPLTDFNLNLNDQLNQAYGEVIRPLVEQRVQDGYPSWEAFHTAYNQYVHRVAKSLIIIHLPLLALVLLILFPRHRMYFAEHFVVATHLFSFLLAAFLVFALLLVVMQVIGWQVFGFDARGLLLLVVAGWLLALKRSYRTGWLRALASVCGWVIGLMLVHMYVYRPLQFFVVLALL